MPDQPSEPPSIIAKPTQFPAYPMTNIMDDQDGDWCRGWRRGSVLAVGSRGWAMGAAVPLRTDIEAVALGRLARQESGRR
jgi:hypothetical protein